MIEVKANFDLPEKEKQAYVKMVEESLAKEHARIGTLLVTLQPNGSDVALEWDPKPIKFERIRRITGYLVGSTDRWNNAKRSEEKDRVKHTGPSAGKPQAKAGKAQDKVGMER